MAFLHPSVRAVFEGRQGHVYFVRGMSCGLIKIGRARDAWTRLSSLQVGSPEELVLVGAIETVLPEELELALHKRFAAQRVRGEWFKVSEELAGYIFRYGRIGWEDTPSPTPRPAPDPRKRRRAWDIDDETRARLSDAATEKVRRFRAADPLGPFFASAS